MALRWVITGLIGIVVAGVVGTLAWLLSPVSPELSAMVFAILALPFGLVLGWILAVAPRTTPPAPHASDSAETRWLDKALAGTTTDIVLVAGLSLTAVSLARVELPTQLVLLGVLLLAFASTATRYAVARRRAVGA